MNKRIDFLSTIVDFHENVKKQDMDFREVISSVPLNAPRYTKEMFWKIFLRDFMGHFEFEELVIFPAIIAWSQDSMYERMIREYVGIHRELVAAGQKVLTKVETDGNPLTKAEQIEVVTAFGDLNNRICRHAAHEDTHIVPLVKNNAAVRFLAGRNTVLYQQRRRATSPS